MRVLVELWKSTVGRKALVALSGLLLGMWVVLHLLGNLTVFSGAATADRYAAALQRIPAWLWMARAGLAAAAVVHVAGVVSLTRASRAARPRHDAHARRWASTVAARSMRVGGALLLAFVVYHLLHLTVGALHPGFVPGRVYDNVVRGLRLPWVAGVYVAAFEMYAHLTGDDPLRVAMRIAPAAHYTMSGLWVDYDLMSTIPGLFVIGEANFSDQGANRLGASALMQGLADGYFILPVTLGGYLAGERLGPVGEDGAEAVAAVLEVRARLEKLLAPKGRRTASDFHRALGRVLGDACGLERSHVGLTKAIDEVAALREAFWEDVTVPGGGRELNQELERAGRVADFLELGELMCRDALAREESCGCHFRVEHQTEDGEARRDDGRFAHVAAWTPGAAGRGPERLIEPLAFETMPPSERSYR